MIGASSTGSSTWRAYRPAWTFPRRVDGSNLGRAGCRSLGGTEPLVRLLNKRAIAARYQATPTRAGSTIFPSQMPHRFGQRDCASVRSNAGMVVRGLRSPSCYSTGWPLRVGSRCQFQLHIVQYLQLEIAHFLGRRREVVSRSPDEDRRGGEGQAPPRVVVADSGGAGEHVDINGTISRGVRAISAKYARY